MTTVKTLEDALPKIKSWIPSTTEDKQTAQNCVDWLDSTLQTGKLDRSLSRRCIQGLRDLCHNSGMFPSTFFVPVAMPTNKEPKSCSAFADIYSVEDKGRLLALKILRLHVDTLDRVIKPFKEEAATWRYLKHPNLAPFLGVTTARQACLVSVWISGGSIAAYLKQTPTANRTQLMRHIVDGLVYLHSMGFVHGGLKSTNALVDVNKGKVTVLLTDFCLAPVLFATGTLQSTSATKGSVRWMAPELLDVSIGPDGTRGPSPQSDIYSLAMVFWEMFSGQTLFGEIKHDFVIMAKVRDGLRPPKPDASSLTPEIWRWMESAWSRDPSARPTLDMLIREGLNATKSLSPKEVPALALAKKISAQRLIIPQHVVPQKEKAPIIEDKAPLSFPSNSRERAVSTPTLPHATGARLRPAGQMTGSKHSRHSTIGAPRPAHSTPGGVNSPILEEPVSSPGAREPPTQSNIPSNGVTTPKAAEHMTNEKQPSSKGGKAPNQSSRRREKARTGTVNSNKDSNREAKCSCVVQ